MRTDGVTFSIARHAQWAPGLTTAAEWEQWAQAPYPIEGEGEPGVKAMPPMLRRRAGLFGKMALEVAYQCLDGLETADGADIPTVFCSRHGEVARALALLTDLANGEPLSPTAFSMSVHNANAGLLGIARKDRANHIALAAGGATIEHAVIEACGLLADGAPRVLLVACEAPLPALFAPFRDIDEQAHAWAWLMTPAAQAPLSLHWRASDAAASVEAPGGLAVAAFHLSGAASMERCDGRLRWRWSRADSSGAAGTMGAMNAMGAMGAIHGTA